MADSREWFKRAQEVIPGGVNSPVRACKSVAAEPLFIAKAKGSKLYTVEGREFVDYVMSWGPMILGHAQESIEEAAIAALKNGASFGAPCPAEVLLAEEICRAVPSMQMVRMVSSGTEATMSALRLARGYTGRDCVVKFEGCYHGHADAFLASAGSGVATLSIPGTPGVPADVVKHTLLAPYNDLDAVKRLFEEKGRDIAAVIVEPVAGNMGLVLPEPGFLVGLRELTRHNGALLIFDEVISGFRLGLAGAQGFFGIEPDLTCLGKIIGAGFPVGAYGGSREIMKNIAPSGGVYQAGTLSGNPVAMAAGLAMLDKLKQSDYAALAARTLELAKGLQRIIEEKGQKVCLNVIGSIFTLYFCAGPVKDFESAKTSDSALYVKFYNQMREQGIYLAPSGFECAFTSFSHSEADFARTLEAAAKVVF